MKRIQFMFNNYGPYAGLHDGTSFMGIRNVYIDSKVLKTIISDISNSKQFNPKDPVFIELSSLVPAWDGLICLSAMNTKIIDGYYIYEYKDTREATLENAKEIILDGHYFSIVTEKNPKITDDECGQVDYGFHVKSHGKFFSIDEAHSYLNSIDVSDRSGTWLNQIDEDVLRGEVLFKRYKYSEYKIGDLGKSVTEIPSDVIDRKPEEISQWAKGILRKAQNIEPDVFWFMGTLPLEIRVHRLKSKNPDLVEL